MKLIDLLHLLDALYNQVEFYTLCFALEIDHERFETRGKKSQIQELLTLLRRHQRLTELIDIVSRERPQGHPNWESVQKAVIAIQEQHHRLAAITDNQGLSDKMEYKASGFLGRQLGHYHLVEKLGQGSMAGVYKGYRADLDQIVAVKVMHTFWTTQATAVHRFQQEAQILATLDHPHIVRVHEFEIYGEDTYYLVMDYVGRHTLKAHLEELVDSGRQMALPKAIELVLQIADALAYAHQRGIVHRDVKPSNIILNEQGQATLTDFGIIKVLGGQQSMVYTATGEMLGTPAYMSPEQALGSQGDARADIYSLGVLLFYLTTGRLPFLAEAPMAVVLKHLDEPVPLPQSYNPAIPIGLQEVILRAMTKDPDGRYPTMLAMIEAIRRIQWDGRPAASFTPPHFSQTTTPDLSRLTESSDWTVTWLPPFQVPPPMPHFVGREAILAALKEKLTAVDGPKVVGIVGFGGVGKTAVAIQAARELRSAFPDGILWAQLDASTPEAELTSMAAAFGQAEALARLTDLPNKAEFMRDMLAHKKLLIVIDQATESEPVKWLISSGPDNRVLITTRNSKLLRNLGADILPLPAMSQAEGLHFLERMIGQGRLQTNLEAACEIVRQTGGLPLALSIAAGFLNQATDLTLAEYADLLQDEQSRLDYLTDWEDAARDVSASFEVSFRALSPPLQQLFAALAIFDGPDFDSHAAAAILQRPTAQVKLDLGRLYFLSLLSSGLGERDDLFPIAADGHGRYRLNPLLKAFARRKLGTDDEPLRRHAATYYTHLAQQHCLPEGYGRLDLDWQNIMAALQWAYHNQVWPTLLRGALALTHRHLGALGFLDSRGRWREARQLLTWAIDGLEKLADPAAQGQLFIRLGGFALRQTDLGAAKNWLEKSWHLLESLPVTPARQIQQGYVCSFLFQTYMHNERQVALAWLKQGEELLPTIEDESVQAEKGYLYISFSGMWGQLGQLVQAKEAAKQGLALLPSSPTTARITGLMNLGIISVEQNEYEKSIGYYQQGIELSHQIGNWRLVLSLQNNLANVEYMRCHFVQALIPLQNVLRLATFMGDIYRQQIAHNALGRLYIRLGEDEKAQDHLHQALALAETNHLLEPEVYVRLNLAHWHIEQGQWDEAQKQIARADAICDDLDIRHQQIEQFRLKAQIALGQGDVEAAQEWISRSIQTAQRARDSLEEGISWGIQGEIYIAQNEVDLVHQAYQRSLQALAAHGPYESAKTQLSWARHYLSSQGDRATARTLLTEAQVTFAQLQTQRELHLTQLLLDELDDERA